MLSLLCKLWNSLKPWAKRNLSLWSCLCHAFDNRDAKVTNTGCRTWKLVGLDFYASWQEKLADCSKARAENQPDVLCSTSWCNVWGRKRYHWDGAMNKKEMKKEIMYSLFLFSRVTVFSKSQTNIRDRFLLWKSRLIGCFPHNRNKLLCFTLSLFVETKRQPYVCRGHWEQHPACGPLAKNKLQIPPGLGIPSKEEYYSSSCQSDHPTCPPFLSRKNPIQALSSCSNFPQLEERYYDLEV